MSMLSSSKGGRSRSYRSASLMHDINMTPFIDVMLVLLIVFMVTAPLMTVGVKVDLPKTGARALSDQAEPLVISVDKEGHVYVMDSLVDADDIGPKLLAITKNNLSLKIYIRGDKSVPYGLIMHVMGLINKAGFTKVALIGQPSDKNESSRKKTKEISKHPDA
jgi:biopolymer transport protein TolR